MKQLDINQFVEYTTAQKKLNDVLRAINLKARRFIKDFKPEEAYYSQLIGQDGLLTKTGWAFVDSFPASQKMNRLLSQRDEFRKMIADMEDGINFTELNIRLWENGECRFLSPDASDLFLAFVILIALSKGFVPKTFAHVVSNRIGRPVANLNCYSYTPVEKKVLRCNLNDHSTIVCSVDKNVPENDDAIDGVVRDDLVRMMSMKRWIINDERDEMFYEIIPYEDGFMVFFARKGGFSLIMELSKDASFWSFNASSMMRDLHVQIESAFDVLGADGLNDVAKRCVDRLFSILDMYRKGDQIEYVADQAEAEVCSAGLRKTGGNSVTRIHVVGRIVKRKSIVRCIKHENGFVEPTNRVFVIAEWERKEYIRRGRNGKKVVIPAKICHRRPELLSECIPQNQESCVKRIRLIE